MIGRHVLPNAALRVLTMIGMEIGTAIGVSIYIESAYGLGGLARWPSARWRETARHSTCR